MAAYVKQADQVVLILSKAEANALRDMAEFADAHCPPRPNNSTAEARSRAYRAICTACEPGSRSGAAIQ